MRRNKVFQEFQQHFFKRKKDWMKPYYERYARDFARPSFLLSELRSARKSCCGEPWLGKESAISKCFVVFFALYVFFIDLAVHGVYTEYFWKSIAYPDPYCRFEMVLCPPLSIVCLAFVIICGTGAVLNCISFWKFTFSKKANLSLLTELRAEAIRELKASGRYH